MMETNHTGPTETPATDNPPAAPDAAAAPSDALARMAQWLRSPAAWLLALVAYALYSRVWALDAKVMHHDESLFAYYGYWLYKGGGYDYQPILHGPVLQYLSAFFFLLFGADQWTMRLPSLLGGLLMFPVAWMWRRYLGGVAGAVAVTGLLAFSPSIAFYTRFLRNDVPYLTATMACAYFLLRALQTGAPRFVWAALMCATLMFCMMESSIFFFAACIGFIVTMLLVDFLVWNYRCDDHRRRWPAWLTDEVQRYRARFARSSAGAGSGLPGLGGVSLCLGGSVVLVAVAGWLFWRILSPTIPLYRPFQLALHGIGLAANEKQVYALITMMAVIVTFLALLAAATSLRRAIGGYGFLTWFSHLLRRNAWHVLAALAAAVLIYGTLFTTFFTFTETASFDHAPNVRDFKGPIEKLTPVQIYRNTWDYWWDQHKLHRIKGPFHYYLPILLLYELPILVLAGLGWMRALRHAARPWLHTGILIAMHVALAAGLVVVKQFITIDWDMMDAKFHVTHSAHLFMVLLYAQLLVHIAPMLYWQGRRAESFITYWGVTTLFAYSYAGEKVPWLTIHTTGPLALLAACELVRLARGVQWRVALGRPRARARRVAFAVAVVVAVLYQARSNHWVLMRQPWSPAERLVFNHTTPDIAETVQIVEDLARETNFGNRLPLYIEGEMGWPLHWYFRDYTNAVAPANENADTTSRPVVMVNWEVAGRPNLQENYVIRRMKVREWWEPELLDFSAMASALMLMPTETRLSGANREAYTTGVAEWRKLWHYLAYREIWIDPKNPSWSNGTNEFALCIRKDLRPTLLNYTWQNSITKRVDVPVFIPY